MRFFTPELYVRFNSPDEDEADAANEAWETALRDYRQHLDEIREQMPSPVKKLAEVYLHDAELLAWEQVAEPFGPQPLWTALAIVSLKHDDKIIMLIYLLGDQVREFPSVTDWPFAKARTHWLYDEVDVASTLQGVFLHRILLSDGRVLEVPFRSAAVHSFPVPPPSDRNLVRQSA